jgi:hypothetical protein
VWFNPATFDDAVAVCATCSGQARCLEIALGYERNLVAGSRWGVWGGLTPEERSSLDRANRTCADGECSRTWAYMRSQARTGDRRADARPSRLIADADDPRHGTAAGYTAHRRAGVPPCTACREAANRAKLAYAKGQVP